MLYCNRLHDRALIAAGGPFQMVPPGEAVLS